MKLRNGMVQLDVKEIEWKTASGIVLSPTATNVIDEFAKVMEVADDVKDIKKGDIAYFKQYNLDQIDRQKIGEKQNSLYFIHKDAIIAIDPK